MHIRYFTNMGKMWKILHLKIFNLLWHKIIFLQLCQNISVNKTITFIIPKLDEQQQHLERS